MSADGPLLSWEVGPVRIIRVEEVVTPVPWSSIIPDCTTDIVDACRPWIDPFVSSSGSHLLLSVHSFVIVTPETTIVVDTCVGESDHPLPTDPTFADRLDAAVDGGLDAVDVVVCTHLHFDHVGWNTVDRDGEMVPRFANARYLVSADEMAATRADDHHDVLPESIDPLITAGVLDEVAMDHRVDPWVRLIPTPGHSVGHVSVMVETDQGLAAITGDAAHSPLQFAHPELHAPSFDADSSLAESTRHTLVSTWADDVLVLGTHFAPPTAGRIRLGDDSALFEQVDQTQLVAQGRTDR